MDVAVCDVADVRPPPRRRLDVDPRRLVVDGDVLEGDVADPAAHLAPDGDPVARTRCDVAILFLFLCFCVWCVWL